MKAPRSGDSPQRQILMAVASILLGEMAIILVIGELPPMPRWREALFATGLLAIPVLSGLYFFVYRGLMAHLSEATRTTSQAHGREVRNLELFAANPHPMWIFDAETLSFLAVNDAAVAHYGYRRDEFLAMTIADIRPAEDMQHLSDSLVRVVANPSVDLVGARHRKKDGTLIDVEITSHPTEFRGRRARMVMVFDLTERKRAESAIESATKRLGLHVAQTPLAIIEWDLDFHVVQWNPAAERIFGFTAAEAIGQHYSFIVPEGVRPALESVKQGLIQGRGGERSTNENVRKDGRVIVCEWYNTSLVDADGKVVAAASQVEDITERKQADEELKKRNLFVESLLENAPIGFAVNQIDDGLPVFISRNFETIYGVAPNSISNVDDYFDTVYRDPVFRETIRERVMADMTSGDPARMRWENVPITTQSGEQKFVTATNIPLPDQNLMISTVQDVTTRRRAEEALIESEKSLQDAQRLAHLGSWQWTMAPDRVYWSAELCDIVGHDPALPAPSFAQMSSYYTSESWKRLTETVEKTVLTGEPYALDLDVVRTDGAVRATHTRGAADRDASGKIVGLHGTVHDITDRKKAEHALRASEARYRAVAQSAHDAIVTADHAGTIVGWNGGAETIFGYPEAEAIGQPLSILMPSRHQAHFAGMNRVLADVEQHVIGETVELEGVRKDGSEFPLELSLAQWENAEGMFVTGILRDITARVQGQAALRLQSAALNAAANPMVITDRDGSIEWVNEAFTTVTGFSADEAIGHEFRVLLSWGAHDESFRAQLRETILTGAVWQGEVTSRRKDGSWYPEDVTLTPVKDALGNVTHCIAITRDLTDEKARHAQFLQAQKMESVGRLAGGIAHDFNNLLTVINNTADLAAANVREDDPIRADLEDIHRAGERAAALTAQLLSFSRKQIVKADIVHLSTLVSDMRPMLARLIGEDIQLVIAPSDGVGNVRADGGQLEQVVMNLVVNARDAMPTGGMLMIETRDVDLDEAFVAMHAPLRPGKHVALIVRDRGVGMDAATRQHIFEPFFTTKGHGQGTGLGLATVYGIVQQSVGSISVESELGQGTTFTIYLPRVDSEAAGPRVERTRKAIRGSETILIVEDDAALLRLSTRILRSAGYQVLMAAEGAEALRVLEDHDGPVDLLLTDVVMPGMGGRELAGRLADIRPEIKVLYTSGYTDDTILRHGVLERTAHFISKPYKQTELTRKVRAVLDGPPNRPVKG